MFTNCRKYIAPSLARDAGRHFGPVSREPIPLDDAYVARVLGNAETSILASASPGRHRCLPLGRAPRLPEVGTIWPPARMGRVRG